MHTETRAAQPRPSPLPSNAWATPPQWSSRSLSPFVPLSLRPETDTNLCTFSSHPEHSIRHPRFYFPHFSAAASPIHGPSSTGRGTPCNSVHFKGVSRLIRRTSPFFIRSFSPAFPRSAEPAGLHCPRPGSGSSRRPQLRPSPLRWPPAYRPRNGPSPLQCARPAAPR